MPRKSNSGSPAPRRVSARIAAAVVTKPSPTPSSAKKTTPKRVKKSEMVVEDIKDENKLNGSDQVSNDASMTEEVVEPLIKKQKTDDENKKPEVVSESKHHEAVTEVMTVDVAAENSTVEHKLVSTPEHVADAEEKSPNTHEVINEPLPSAVTTESEFEIIDKFSVPPSDSDEVKAAVTAQGEDGSLLVNFVQVSKDEVLAPEILNELNQEAKVLSPENHCDKNGINASTIPHGDNGTNEINNSPKKMDEIAHEKVEAIVKPQQDMHAEL